MTFEQVTRQRKYEKPSVQTHAGLHRSRSHGQDLDPIRMSMTNFMSAHVSPDVGRDVRRGRAMGQW